MNKKYLVFAFSICLLLTSCNDNSKKKVEDAGEEIQTAGHDLKDAVIEATQDETEDWQKFKTEAEQKIIDNQKQIDDLKARLDKASKKLKPQYQQKVNELEQKNADLKKQLDNYKDQGQQAWEKFKTDFNSQMNQLKTAIDDSSYHDF